MTVLKTAFIILAIQIFRLFGSFWHELELADVVVTNDVTYSIVGQLGDGLAMLTLCLLLAFKRFRKYWGAGLFHAVLAAFGIVWMLLFPLKSDTWVAEIIGAGISSGSLVVAAVIQGRNKQTGKSNTDASGSVLYRRTFIGPTGETKKENPPDEIQRVS